MPAYVVIFSRGKRCKEQATIYQIAEVNTSSDINVLAYTLYHSCRNDLIALGGPTQYEVKMLCLISVS